MSGKIRGLVGLTQIRKWEREHAALGRQARKIESRQDDIKALIDAAKAVIQRDRVQERAPYGRRRKSLVRRPARVAAPKAAPAAEAITATAEAPRKIDRRRQSKSEWKTIIREVALTSDHPVPYAEARDEIMKTHLAEKLQKSEKGFYHAISKLSKAGEIVAYKGHLFSPELFTKFTTDLAAGLVRDLKFPNVAHRSPMGDAVKTMMQSRPNGAESGHIIWELRKNPEFAAIIEKNKTHPYNVLARLTKTGELVKRGKRYYWPTEKTETPSTTSMEGVSKVTSEEIPTSLFAQSSESRIG
ncbi:MAG TPA: hypothetical protein VIJ04_11205 [Xanthobacteraceae bacterium]